MLRSAILRAGGTAVTPSTAVRQTARITPTTCIQLQKRHEHAISNPTLANIEQRWEGMPPQEQADLWMALRDRMKVDWHDMTLQEKKAAYWIAFGPHGPRKQVTAAENWQVFKLTMYGLLASCVLFAGTRYFARPPPRTMTQEYQELSNQYLKEQNSEPITGYASEGYTGRGMIQSKPSGKDPNAEVEE